MFSKYKLEKMAFIPALITIYFFNLLKHTKVIIVSCRQKVGMSVRLFLLFVYRRQLL